MQRLIPILLLYLFVTPVLRAQPFRVLLNREGEVPVVDAVRTPDNTFDVARYPEAYLNYPSAVLTGILPGEILTAYIKTDSARSIETVRSLDRGRTWTHEPFHSNWDGETFRSLSLFHLGQPPVVSRPADRRSRRTSTRRSNSLALFSGGNPVMISASYTNGHNWSNFYPANNFGGFRISGLVQLRNGRIMALFHDDGRFLYHDEESDGTPLRKSVIYKIYSDDGGLTWTPPQIALKHNLHGLYDAVIIYSPSRRDNDLMMIASERETAAAYISFSSDNGDTWSYPEKLPSFIQGDRFGIASYKRQLLISYRDMCRTLNNGEPNPTFGDIVLWAGDLRELIRGNGNGIKVRIADNYPVGGPADHSDLKFSDCGYVSVLPLAPNEVCVVAYGRWETQELPFVRNFVLNPVELRRFILKTELTP